MIESEAASSSHSSTSRSVHITTCNARQFQYHLHLQLGYVDDITPKTDDLTECAVTEPQTSEGKISNTNSATSAAGIPRVSRNGTSVIVHNGQGSLSEASAPRSK